MIRLHMLRSFHLHDTGGTERSIAIESIYTLWSSRFIVRRRTQQPFSIRSYKKTVKERSYFSSAVRAVTYQFDT